MPRFVLPGTRDLFNRVRPFAITMIVIRGWWGDRVVLALRLPRRRHRHLSQSQMKILRIKVMLAQGHDASPRQRSNHESCITPHHGMGMACFTL